MFLPSLCDKAVELLLAHRVEPATGVDVRDSNADGYAEDDERRLDGIGECLGQLAHDALHLYQGEEGTVHQYSWHHRYDTRYGKAMVGCVEHVDELDAQHADEQRTDEGCHDRSLVETDVVVAGAQVDEVSRAYGNDAAEGYYPQQAPGDVENHGEAHGGYCGGYGIAEICVVGRHAQVFHEIVYSADGDSHGDAERHCRYHEQGVDGPVESHLDVVLYHVGDEVYQRHSGHDEEGACHERMPRRVGMEHGGKPMWQGSHDGWRHREECREPCEDCGDEGGYTDVNVSVGPFLVEEGTEAETDDGGNGGIEECRPVAAELYAESSACEAGSHSHLVGGVIARLLADFLQFLLVFVERVIFFYRPPGEFADGRNCRHVDAVLVAALEFAERVLLVAEVHLQHVVSNVDVQILLRQSEISRRAVEVSQNAAGVGAACHENFARAHQQVEFSSDFLFFLVFIYYLFHFQY